MKKKFIASFILVVAYAQGNNLSDEIIEKQINNDSTEKKIGFGDSVNEVIKKQLSGIKDELNEKNKLKKQYEELKIKLSQEENNVLENNLIKNSELPASKGIFTIYKHGVPIKNKAYANDSKGNNFYLSEDNNNLVKEIKSDYIVYKGQEDTVNLSTLVVTSSKDNILENSIVGKNPDNDLKARNDVRSNDRLPSLEEAVKAEKGKL